MTAWAYYNEFDPYAAEWLRNLIKAGHIAPGYVDDRNVLDVSPDDLRGFCQVHLFAGVGVWSYSFRRAGWGDSRPVWSMSCPCQPFSPAGKGKGFTDERHLWPAAHYLIEQCRPGRIYGEQVADRGGLAWLDLVHADMEGTGYAFGAVDTCSASVGAPHRRQRLRFVARALEQPESAGLERHSRYGRNGNQSRWVDTQPNGLGSTAGAFGGLADDGCRRCDEGSGYGAPGHRPTKQPFDDRDLFGGLVDSDNQRQRETWCACSGERSAERGAFGGLADTTCVGLEGCRSENAGRLSAGIRTGSDGLGGCDVVGRPPSTGPVNGHWRNADWLLCRDGKWRPVESGTFPLAHGAPSRVGRLRAYGNAVDAEATRVFIEATL